MRAAEDYQIQGHAEQIIDAFVERCESDDDLVILTFVAEQSINFKQNLRFVMASSLVDINYAPMVNVKVMNPFSIVTVINAKTIIGTSEILTSPKKISWSARTNVKRVTQTLREGSLLLLVLAVHIFTLVHLLCEWHILVKFR